MKEHECRENKTCTCYLLADEPNEDCPVHGSGLWPPRCEICGRFMKWEIRNASKVAESYEGCECPDCGGLIPVTAAEGDDCKNCGHVFWIALKRNVRM